LPRGFCKIVKAMPKDLNAKYRITIGWLSRAYTLALIWCLHRVFPPSHSPSPTVWNEVKSLTIRKKITMSTVALSHRLDLTRAAGGESGGGSGWRRRESASTTTRHGSASMAAVAHLLMTRGGAGWPLREATRTTLPSPPLSQFSLVTLYFLPLLSLAHTTRVVVLGCCCSL
jgi:hypothetical protein